MTSTIPVSEELLKTAFALAEARLIEDDNYSLTQKITNETRPVRYEGSLNSILLSALSDTLPKCSFQREYNKIDICGLYDACVVLALESKGMVANSHASDPNGTSLDVFGISTKLYPDPHARNSVQTDMEEVSNKIPPEMDCPRFELFVPVIYELYREGGDQSEWFAERKPWVTLPKFRRLRETMTDDLIEWFYREDPRMKLIHAAESIELRDANDLWWKQAQSRFPKFTFLEAYVSFYAFGRFVE